MKHIFSVLSIPCLAVVLLFGGCAGYELGGTAPEGIKSVHLAPVINKTTEPAIELEVTKALRQRIQFDGRVTIENSKLADAVLEVTMTDYELQALSYDKNKTSRAREYRLIITADSQLKNRETGKVISSINKVYGEATFPFSSDLTGAKRSTLPVAAADLSRFLLDGLLENW
ncbi:MAG: hypothetical protein K9M45_05035 [Kiritimatiellales bacterium]|nr:hypothetical protein [Kiritimatiellales bacterium]